MSYKILRVERTPNPSARRFTVEPAPGRIVSARTGSGQEPAEPTGDPLADALLAIDGVSGVLIHTDFLTVSIDPGSKWDPVLKRVESALSESSDGP